MVDRRLINITTFRIENFWSFFPPESEKELGAVFQVVSREDLLSREFNLSEEPYFSATEKGLTLNLPSGLDFHLDFLKINYRRKFSPSTDLLCRACGWHLGLRSVWDLTAGLGVDATMLAQAGFRVKAIEQNPYLFLLLKNATYEREKELILSGASKKSLLNIEFGQSQNLIREEGVSKLEWPQVAYYDPMYPSKNKSALPSKEMQVLRELNGTDGEDPTLIRAALEMGISRVVVKRPIKAPVIIEKPNAQIKGKLIRYDLYLAGR